MKVAILGGGYAGLSLAWYICNYALGSARIDIFDPAPVAMGASRISLGLLHPFLGKQAKKAWMASRAIRDVHKLITEAAAKTRSPIVTTSGVLRPATNPDMISAFQERAEEFPNEVKWWDKEECEAKIPGMELPDGGGGLYIQKAVTINVPLYLRGIWVASARHSVQYLKLSVLGKDTLAPYDRVVVALGANTLDFGVLNALPMTRVKGQVIEVKWPDDLPPLPMSLSGEGQMVMMPGNKSCLLGSTYEREFKDFKGDPDFARDEIFRKIAPFFPQITKQPILSCRARMRGSTKTRLPLLGKVNEKVWFFTGLGSKGLLYHAMAAKQFAQALMLDDPSQIMPELHHSLEQPQQQS